MGGLFDLTGRIAMVTGGGSGLGRDMALALAEAGAGVAVVDLHRELAEDVAACVHSIGCDALALETDGVDLTSTVTLRFEDGLCAHFDCSQAAMDVYDYVEVMGSEGRARSEWRPSYRLAVQSQRIPEYAKTRVATRPPQPLAQAYVAELTEFASSIRESRQPSVTGADAVRVLEVLDAITLSDELGRPVSIERSS